MTADRTFEQRRLGLHREIDRARDDLVRRLVRPLVEPAVSGPAVADLAPEREPPESYEG